jgi:hypothetical protein
MATASRVVVPMIGSPPMPMKRRLAEAGPRQVEADQGSQTAAARDHADGAGAEDVGVVARHDADRRLARRDHAGRVRADDPGVAARRRRMDGHDVVQRDVLGQDDQQLHPGPDGVERRVPSPPPAE